MSGVGDYMARACSAPLLTAKQEIFLARQLQEGSSEGATVKQQRLARKAKERLIMSNMRLVVIIAKKYCSRCKTLTMEDLFQEGVFGLNRAAEMFDPTRGYKFSTYAHKWIEHSVRRAVSTYDATIRVPVHVADAITRYKRAASSRDGRSLDLREFSQGSLVPADRLESGLMVATVATLDRRQNSEEGGLINVLASPQAEPSYMEQCGIDAMHLQRCLLKLPPLEREVVMARYGLGGRDPLSFDAIGKRLRLSRDRVTTLKRRAIRHLNANLQSSIR